MLTAEQKAGIRERVQAPFRTAAPPAQRAGRSIPPGEQRLLELIAREDRIRREEQEAERQRRHQAGLRIRGGRRPRSMQAVIALAEDGSRLKWWPSCADAATELGVSPSAVSMAVHRGYRCKGIRMCRADLAPIPAKSPLCRKVVRLADDQQFDSISGVIRSLEQIGPKAFDNEHKKLSYAIRYGLPYRGHVYAYADQGAAPPPCGRIGPQRSAVLADGQRCAV